MRLLIVALALLAAPANKPKGPKPSELAHLQFLGGDLGHAVESARQCNRVEQGKCNAMFKALAEYQYLASRSDRFTPAEAKSFVALDRVISKTVPGKLTEPVLRQFITEPLQLAAAAVRSGDRAQAEALVKGVLEVDPANAEAKALLIAPDAGR